MASLVKLNSFMASKENWKQQVQHRSRNQNVKLQSQRPNPARSIQIVYELCKANQVRKAMQVMEQMAGSGASPNEFTYSFLLQAAYKERGANEAIRLLDRILSHVSAKTGTAAPNLVSYNVILTALCKENRTDEALLLFRRLPSLGHRPNIVSHNILLRSLCQSSRWPEAQDLLFSAEKLVFSAITYNILIDSLATQGMTREALEVLDLMACSGLRPEAASYNPILARLCRDGGQGDLAAAAECLALMARRRCDPNEGTYNAIAAGLCEAGMAHEAFVMVQSLSRGFNYKRVVIGLCKKGNTYSALRLMPEMIRFGFTPDARVYSSIIRGLCLEGEFGAAIEIYDVLARESSSGVERYLNAVVLGLCKSGKSEAALAVLETEMVWSGFVPREKTYAIVVEGIARQGDIDIAGHLLSELNRKQVMSRATVERLNMQYHLEVEVSPLRLTVHT